MRSPPLGWRETYNDALRACVELGRPRRDRLLLLTRLVGLAAIFGTYERECLRELLDQLVRDSGLAEWNALTALEPAARLTAAFQNTQKRFDATPPHDRGDDPIKSLRALANSLGTAMAVIPVAHDVEFLRELPDLSPFAPLLPALGAFAQLRAGMLARLTGRIPDAFRIYTALLERIRRPDLTDELLHKAQSFLEAQLSADDVTTSESSLLASPATSAAQTGQSSPTHTPLLLSHGEGGAIVITGVVMLGRPRGLNLTRISLLVSELSRIRAQQGSQCFVVTP